MKKSWVAVILGLVMGCASSNDQSQAPTPTGSLRVPLSATSYVGKQYVLCQGTFGILNFATGQTVTLDASQHTTEPFLTQTLPSGDYQVSLADWQLCEATTEGLVPVDAQLWSGDTQWVYVNPLQASYAYFSFMVAGETLAFDGELVIQINVWQGYGTAGGSATGGYGSTGGAMMETGGAAGY
jgi:hypothetical protein